MTAALRAWVALYVQDVREHPRSYKESVRAAPEASAVSIVSGLSDAEVRSITRDLRAERKVIHGY